MSRSLSDRFSRRSAAGSGSRSAPANVPMRTFPGANLPEYVELAERAIRELETDLVIACRPRFPGLLIAMLLRRAQQVPVIADLDEWELSWTGANDAPCSSAIAAATAARSRTSTQTPAPSSRTRAAPRLSGEATDRIGNPVARYS